jgi:hypothetical protein
VEVKSLKEESILKGVGYVELTGYLSKY